MPQKPHLQPFHGGQSVLQENSNHQQLIMGTSRANNVRVHVSVGGDTSATEGSPCDDGEAYAIRRTAVTMDDAR